MSRPRAELRTAYVWWCEACGHENFAQGVKAEFGPGEREQVYRAMHELDEWAPLPEGWESFELCTIPSVVICGSPECKTEHDTFDERLLNPDSGEET